MNDNPYFENDDDILGDDSDGASVNEDPGLSPKLSSSLTGYVNANFARSDWGTGRPPILETIVQIYAFGSNAKKSSVRESIQIAPMVSLVSGHPALAERYLEHFLACDEMVFVHHLLKFCKQVIEIHDRYSSKYEGDEDRCGIHYYTNVLTYIANQAKQEAEARYRAACLNLDEEPDLTLIEDGLLTKPNKFRAMMQDTNPYTHSTQYRTEIENDITAFYDSFFGYNAETDSFDETSSSDEEEVEPIKERFEDPAA